MSTALDYQPLLISKEKASLWLRDPIQWVYDVVGMVEPVTISLQQQEALRGYRDLVLARLHRYALSRGETTVPLSPREDELCRKFGISIQAGKGTGKNALVAWIVFHFMDCMQLNPKQIPNVRLMFTGPTEDQLKNNLWAEMYKWMSRSPYLMEMFRHSTEKVYKADYAGKEVFATWKTSSKSADPETQGETLAGKHADFMILGADEASGLSDATFRPLESTMTGICNLAIITFNPTKAKGYAINTQTIDRQNWLAYHWDAEQSECVDPLHVERYAKKYGRDSNMYRINVRGLPPHADNDVFIPYYLADLAVEHELEIDDNDVAVAGLDVAGAGADSTVLIIGTGGKVQETLETNLIRKRDIANWVEDYWLKYDLQAVAVDVNGLGSGVAEELEDMGVYVIWVNAGCEAERQPEKYERLRDELWGDVRDALETYAMSLPNHEELIGELTSIKFEDKRGSRGRIKLESKREMKRRGLKSPDHADALCLWWKATQERGKRQRHSIHRRRRNGGRRLQDWRIA